MRTHILLIALLLPISFSAQAKGHGGGHGGGHGHSGGHSSGHSSSHSSSHSVSSAPRSSARQSSRSTPTRHSGGSVSMPGRAAAGGARVATPSIPARTLHLPVPHERAVPAQAVTRTTPSGYPAGGVATPYGYYAPGYDPYYYAFAPYYGYPYYNMWSAGLMFTFTPNYGYASPNPGGYYDNNGGPGNTPGITGLPENGYAVYAHDTIKGLVTVHPKNISVEATDSGKNYDYKFKVKDEELAIVTLFNEDNKELDLVKLSISQKKLWRVIHTGTLNLYDDHADFIYSPSDIAINHLVVNYNGSTYSLVSANSNEAKERLTEFVNRAYGKNLRARAFSWNELLVYIDKLD